VLLVAIACSKSRADDWPQWLGPQRDSVWREDGILTEIPADGLTVKWRTPVSYGYAGPAVADGRVYVSDYAVESGEVKNGPSLRAKLEGKEQTHCFDARTGEKLWTHAYDCAYEVSYPGGPRVTPTVADGKIYTLGTMGHLRCLDAGSGKLLWGKSLTEQYDTNTPIWGFSGHPLLHGNKLICLVGGQGSVAVALDKDTGTEIWRALSAREPGYCAPIAIQAGGTEQLIVWHAEAINGLNPETGDVYWSVPLKPSYGMSIATPRHYGDFLFASGIGNQAALLKLDSAKPSAEVEWLGNVRTAVYCANSSPFIEGDVIYGVGHQGELRAVDLETGQRLWGTFAATTGSRPGRYGTAFIVKQGNRFLLYNDQGDLIFARLTPQGYQESGRFHVLDTTNEALGRKVVWSHPAFANKCLYARNDKELVCVSLAAE
jgi:outer membrane protein assembly factor BamB